MAALICFIALVFFGASSNYPFAQARVDGVSISGSVCCTSTGNCPAGQGGQGLPRVPVRLKCDNDMINNVVIYSDTGNLITTTNADGIFNFIIPDAPGLLDDQPVIPCNVTVRLPINSHACPVLSTASGTLTSTVRAPDDTLINSPYVGLLLKATLDGFVVDAGI